MNKIHKFVKWIYKYNGPKLPRFITIFNTTKDQYSSWYKYALKGGSFGGSIVLIFLSAIKMDITGILIGFLIILILYLFYLGANNHS